MRSINQSQHIAVCSAFIRVYIILEIAVLIIHGLKNKTQITDFNSILLRNKKLPQNILFKLSNFKFDFSRYDIKSNFLIFSEISIRLNKDLLFLLNKIYD